MYKEFITRVEINNHWWDVFEVDSKFLAAETNEEDFDEKKHYYFGYTHYIKQEIYINEQQSDIKYINTILHELIHAYLHSYAMNPKDDEEWIMFYDTNYLALAKLQEEVINALNSHKKFIGKGQNDEIN